MIGFDVPEEQHDMRKKLLWDHSIFTGEAKPNVVRLLPALNLKKEDASVFLDAVKNILQSSRLESFSH